MQGKISREEVAQICVSALDLCFATHQAFYNTMYICYTSLKNARGEYSARVKLFLQNYNRPYESANMENHKMALSPHTRRKHMAAHTRQRERRSFMQRVRGWGGGMVMRWVLGGRRRLLRRIYLSDQDSVGQIGLGGLGDARLV
ncbi:unnamed protein product [Prunus brigantina]